MKKKYFRIITFFFLSFMFVNAFGNNTAVENRNTKKQELSFKISAFHIDYRKNQGKGNRSFEFSVDMLNNDLDPVGLVWEMGDGKVIGAKDKKLFWHSYTFSDPGEFSVKVKMFFKNGKFVDQSLKLNVSNGPKKSRCKVTFKGVKEQYTQNPIKNTIEIDLGKCKFGTPSKILRSTEIIFNQTDVTSKFVKSKNNNKLIGTLEAKSGMNYLELFTFDSENALIWEFFQFTAGGNSPKIYFVNKDRKPIKNLSVTVNHGKYDEKKFKTKDDGSILIMNQQDKAVLSITGVNGKYFIHERIKLSSKKSLKLLCNEYAEMIEDQDEISKFNLVVNTLNSKKTKHQFTLRHRGSPGFIGLELLEPKLKSGKMFVFTAINHTQGTISELIFDGNGFSRTNSLRVYATGKDDILTFHVKLVDEVLPEPPDEEV